MNLVEHENVSLWLPNNRRTATFSNLQMQPRVHPQTCWIIMGLQISFTAL